MNGMRRGSGRLAMVGAVFGMVAAMTTAPADPVSAGPTDGSSPVESTEPAPSTTETVVLEADPAPSTTETTAVTETTVSVGSPEPEPVVSEAPPETIPPETDPRGTTTPEPTVTETTSSEPRPSETSAPAEVGPAAPGDTYDVTVAARCDPGYTPVIRVTNVGTGTARVSVGEQSRILVQAEEWNLPWPASGRDPAELDPAPKWDAVDIDTMVVFDQGTLSLPPDCPPSNVPSAPENVTSTAGDGEVALAWTAPRDGGTPIDDYIIEHNAYPVEDDAWTTVVDGVGTTTSVVVTGLTNGETYMFRITALNSNGLGVPAEAKETPGVVPGAPQSLTAEATTLSGQIRLTWQPPLDDGGPDVFDYVIERSLTGVDPWVTVDDGEGASTTYDIGALSPGIRLHFRVSAVNQLGTGAPGGVATAVPNGVPSPPRSVAVAPTNRSGQLRVTWLAPLSDGGLPITDYVIERSPNGTSSWTTVVDGVNTNTSYTVTNITNGTRYYIRVRARSLVGLSPPSNVPSAIPRAAPTAPRTLTAAATGLPGQVRLSWIVPLSNGGSPITDYIIQRSPNGTTGWTTITDGVNTNRAFTVTGLITGSRYYFRVRAKNAAGFGAWSNLAGAIPRYLLSAPRSLTATPTNRSGQIRVSWAAPLSNGGAAITDYIIQRSPNGTSSWTTIADGVNTNTAYTVTGLTNGVRYHFRVYARTSRATSPATPVVSAVPRTAPTAVRSLAASPNNLSGQVRVRWYAPSSNGGSAITDYVIQRSPNGTSSWTTIADGVNTNTAYTVTGLTNGVRYYFRVYARNAAGSSPVSVVVSAIPRTVPSQPAWFYAEASYEGFYLEWRPPANTGGSPITSYLIQWWDYDASIWTSLPLIAPTRRSGFLDAPGYGCGAFRIAAVNAAGRGPFLGPLEVCYFATSSSPAGAAMQPT